MRPILLFLLLLLCSTSFSQTTDDYADSAFNGIWWNVTYNRTPAYVKGNFQYLKGAFASLKWSDLEISPGNFRWDSTNGFNQTMNTLANAGFKICLIMYTGPAAPGWIYRTPYNVDSLVSNTGDVYPDYLSSATSTIYRTRWRLMLDSVMAHVNTMSATVKSNFVILQSAEGATGDESPFHDTRINPVTGATLAWPYNSSDPTWMVFRDTAWAWTNREIKTYYPSATNLSGSKVTLLVNPSNDSAQISQYTSFIFGDTVNRKLNHTWLKAGNVGHGYQLNTETTTKSQYDPYINTITPAGSGRTRVRSRSEMDEFYGWFTEYPKWSYYWLSMNALHFGLDCWMTTLGSMADTNYNAAFPLFANYAGLKDPSKARKGFCALRDGLDASDFTRFPIPGFGNGTIDTFSNASSTSRANRIVAAFAGFGANQEDDTAANSAPMKQRHADSLNDVGWGIFPGNYERFINQVNLPSASTVYRGGYWRRGPFSSGKPLNPFGRFAKGFDSVHSITNLYFNINDSLALDSSSYGSRNAMIRITYLDSGNQNSWKLIYYVKTSLSAPPSIVTKNITNSNPPGTVSWKVDTTLITNLWAKMPVTSTQADLQIQKGTKGARQCFHLIEISNQPGSPNFRMSQPVAKSLPAQDNKQLLLYPNPGKGKFTVHWTKTGFEKAFVRLINSEGMIIYTSGEMTAGKANIDIQNKPAGVYYVEVHNGKSILQAKFIKE